jgi:acyl-CoA synthetase (NDP forming)
MSAPTKTAPPSNSLAIHRLLRPRSVAIVGASPELGSLGGAVLANLERFGYSGAIHVISRTRKEINGRTCVPSIDDLPAGVDAIVLVLPEAAVFEALGACVRREAGSAIVFASGFAEMGEEGRRKQQRLASIAREGGLILNGPNCVGVANYVDGIPLTFEPLSEPSAGQSGVALIAQSGGLTTHLRLALASKGVPVAYTISTGNEAGVGAEDFLAYLVEDESTRVIALFLEQIRRPIAFLEWARGARRRGKPVVLLHPGRTQRARESAQSHTGALAGSYAAMKAVLEREGVLLVPTIDELIDVTALLARWPSPPSPGVAIVTNSGGFKAAMLDFCEELGVGLSAFAPATCEALKTMLPEFAPIDNPLDLTTITISKPGIYGQAAQAVLDDRNVGALLMSVIPGARQGQMARFASLLPVLERSQKPVAFAPFGDDAPLAEELIEALRRTGILLFKSGDRAMRALARLDAYGRAMRLLENAQAPAEVAALPVPGCGLIPEYRAKNYLAAAGIAIPDGALASNVADAQMIAARIGYPVVLKAQSNALPHKTEAGGIFVDIADSPMLAIGWEQLHQNVRRSRAGIELEGVLVEKMAPAGLELIVGAKRDPEWGSILMVGLGGIWTEALNDVRLLSGDADEAAILSEMGKLNGAQVLAGLRGAPRLDARAVANCAAILGGLMRATPELIEIEINPLRVYAEGAGVLALDALMKVASE